MKIYIYLDVLYCIVVYTVYMYISICLREGCWVHTLPKFYIYHRRLFCQLHSTEAIAWRDREYSNARTQKTTRPIAVKTKGALLS